MSTIKKILATSARKLTPNQEKFLDEYHKGTHQHPFDRSRIHMRDKDNFTLVDVSPTHEGGIHIHSLSSHIRRKGNATHTLHMLHRLADKHKIRLDGIAEPYGNHPGNMKKTALHNWYKKHGWKVPKSGYMHRDPT